MDVASRSVGRPIEGVRPAAAVDRAAEPGAICEAEGIGRRAAHQVLDVREPAGDQRSAAGDEATGIGAGYGPGVGGAKPLCSNYPAGLRAVLSSCKWMIQSAVVLVEWTPLWQSTREGFLVRCFCLVLPAGFSPPTPSSDTVTVADPFERATLTLALDACAYLATLVIDSATT